MRKLVSINKFLPTVSALVVLWIGVSFFSLIHNSVGTKNQEIVPESAYFSFKFQTKDFIKHAIYSMIFESKDQELINKLAQFLKSESKGKVIDDLGIDYFSDFTVFGDKINHKTVFILSFNLLDKNKFKKNAQLLLNKQSAFFVKNDVGLIAISSGSHSKEQLNGYLSSLKMKKNFTIQSNQNQVLFDLEFKKFVFNKQTNVKGGYITSTFGQKELLLNGKIQLQKAFTRPRKWTLEEELELHPFTVESFLFDKLTKDSIQDFFNKIGLYTPPLEGIAFNYYGLDIQDHETGLVFTPRFDMILHFEEEISDELLYFDEEKLRKFGFYYDGIQLKAGDIDYTIDRLDNQTLFIGFNRDIVSVRKNYNLFKISGNPAKLTEINGGGFILSMINIVPEYKATKNFLNSIKECNIRITPKNNQTLFIRGKINFLEKNFLYNEMMKFYLTLNGIY